MNTPAAIESTPEASTCCIPGQPLDDATAQQLARVFKALGDPTRVKLYSLIAAAAPDQMCACDLTEPVGLSQPTVSHHMKILVDGIPLRIVFHGPSGTIESEGADQAQPAAIAPSRRRGGESVRIACCRAIWTRSR